MESGTAAAGAPRRRPEREHAISPAQAARFVLGLRDGMIVAEAAAVAGVAVTTLYYRRRRDPDFAACWGEAAALAKAAEAEAWRAKRIAAAGGRDTVVRGHVGRQLVRKRKPPQEFDRARKQTFLDQFAASCDLEVSAGEAGISLSSFYRALQSDPAFRAGFEEALQIGYLCLEAEAVRAQREAQRAYAIEPADGALRAQGFERTMQLLRHYKRTAGGTIGRPAERRPTRWTFEATIEAIEKSLKALGVEIREAGGDEAPEVAPPPRDARSPSPGDPGEDPERSPPPREGQSPSPPEGGEEYDA